MCLKYRLGNAVLAEAVVMLPEPWCCRKAMGARAEEQKALSASLLQTGRRPGLCTPTFKYQSRSFIFSITFCKPIPLKGKTTKRCNFQGFERRIDKKESNKKFIIQINNSVGSLLTNLMILS